MSWRWLAGAVVGLALALPGCGGTGAQPLLLREPPRVVASVRLLSGRVVPPADAPAGQVVPGSVREGREHFLVALASEPTLEQHARLAREGTRLLEYLGGRVYLASAPVGSRGGGGTLARLAVWSGPLHPRDKLDPAVTAQLERGGAQPGRVEGDDPEARVVFFADVGPEQGLAIAKAHGVTLLSDGACLPPRVRIVDGEIEALAKLDAVQAVVPLPSPPAVEAAAPAARGGPVAAGPRSAAAPTGKGVRIGICDLGVWEEHPAFKPTAGQPSRFHVADPSAESAHGTGVATVAAGADSSSGFQGGAPEALLADYVPFRADPALYEEAFAKDGTHITNHSYPLTNKPVYDQESRDLDRIVRGDADPCDLALPARPQVWAAGNAGFCNKNKVGHWQGYYSLWLAPKNPILVGSVDALDEQLSRFSSRGPTYDGRIKPDLVAPGAQDSKLVPAQCDDEAVVAQWSGLVVGGLAGNVYRAAAGTSYAAPYVSGVIARMMERATWEGVQPEALRPSTYKALLVQTAADRVWQPGPSEPAVIIDSDTDAPVRCPPGPDFATGFGLVDGDAAVEAIGDTARWIEGTLATQGDEHWYCVEVQESLAQLDVVIAWDDLGGSLSTAHTESKLVNDLDLQLIGPDGVTVLPWSLKPPTIAPEVVEAGEEGLDAAQLVGAAAGEDHANNVERVTVPKPEVGVWWIGVRAHELPLGRLQPYSLAASHPLSSLCFVVPPDPPLPDLCRLFPPLCDRPWDPPRFDPVLGSWRFEPGAVLPLAHLRRVQRTAPLPVGPAWEAPPPLSLTIVGAPRGARALLFDDRGALLADAAAGPARLTLTVARPDPARRRYLTILDASGGRYLRPLQLAVELGP